MYELPAELHLLYFYFGGENWHLSQFSKGLDKKCMFNNEEVNTYNRSIVLWEQAAHTTQEGQLSVTRDSNLQQKWL